MKIQSTRSRRVDDIFEELSSYVPDDDLNGPHGIVWGYDEGLMTDEYLEDLVRVRRTQFLEGFVTPDGWNQEKIHG